MTITATQYVFYATTFTATTVPFTATSIGGYTVPASTRAQIIAVTIANSATTNATAYVDAAIYNGTSSFNISGKRVAVYPGGSLIVIGAEKHVMPTSGAFQVTTYTTTPIDVALTAIEVT